MALHQTLPIYKVAYDLLDVVTDLVKNMPRSFKQSIGGKISGECIEIVTLVFRANCATNKAPHLGELLERLQVAELLLRLSRDKRLISTSPCPGVTGPFAAPIRKSSSRSTAGGTRSCR